MGRYPKAGSRKSHHNPKSNSQLTDASSRASSVPGGGFAAINNSAGTSGSAAHETDSPESRISASASQVSAPGPSKKRKPPGSSNVIAKSTTTSKRAKIGQGGDMSVLEAQNESDIQLAQAPLQSPPPPGLQFRPVLLRLTNRRGRNPRVTVWMWRKS